MLSQIFKSPRPLEKTLFETLRGDCLYYCHRISLIMSSYSHLIRFNKVFVQLSFNYLPTCFIFLTGFRKQPKVCIVEEHFQQYCANFWVIFLFYRMIYFYIYLYTAFLDRLSPSKRSNYQGFERGFYHTSQKIPRAI